MYSTVLRAAGTGGSIQLHSTVGVGTVFEVRLPLPDWDFGGLDIWAVTPQRQAQPAKVRQAIAALQAYLARLPGVVDAPAPA